MPLRTRWFYFKGALGCAKTAIYWAMRRNHDWRNQTLADSLYCLRVAIIGYNAEAKP